MIIGIDARFALGKRRGIGNYTLNLISNLAKIDRINQYILYVDRNDEEQILPKQANIVVNVLKPRIYPVWEQLVLPIQAFRDKVDVLHCTGNTFPIWNIQKLTVLVTIHDVMFLKQELKFGSWYQFLGNKYRAFIVGNFSHIPSSIITVSQFSKQDLLNTVRKLVPEIVFHTYESHDPLFSKSDKYQSKAILKSELGLDSPYILALGAIDPRKNTRNIIRVFGNLKKKYGINYKLVIVGISKRNHSIFNDLINSLDLQESILLTSFVSTDILAALYQCSTIFLYPSSYEGFGIPLLEAMASGTPIISSNVTSIPEIVGDAGILIEPTNLSQLEESIMKLLSDQLLRADLISKGLKRVKDFSWESMAMKTLEIYNCTNQSK